MAADLVSRLRSKVPALSVPKTAHNIVGLDLEPDALIAVELMHGSSEPKKLARTTLSSGLFGQGEYSREEELAGEIKQFFRENKLGKRVRIGVANNRAVLRTLEIPKIDDLLERDAAIKFKASETLPLSLDSAVFDYRVVDHIKDGDTALDQVVVVAAPRELVEPMERVVRKAGLKLEGIDLAAFGLIRALANKRTGNGGATAYCYLGSSTTVAVGVANVCSFARTFFLPKEDDGIAPIHRVTGELSTSLEYYHSIEGAKPIDEMLVCGPVCKDEQIVEQLGAAVGLPVKAVESLTEVADGNSSFTMAYGLALNEVAP